MENAGILLHCCDEYYCHIQSLIIASVLFDGKLMINNNAPLRLVQRSLQCSIVLFIRCCSDNCKRTATKLGRKCNTKIIILLPNCNDKQQCTNAKCEMRLLQYNGMNASILLLLCNGDSIASLRIYHFAQHCL